MFSPRHRNDRPLHNAGRFTLNAAMLALCVAAIFVVVVREANAQVVDPTFACTNGTVKAMQLAGDTLVIGGSFTWAGPTTGSMVALDATTGRAISPWTSVKAGPNPVGYGARETDAVLPDGTGGCYAGGFFTSVAGVPREKLAHVRADGTLDALNPGVDGVISALAHIGTTLYVAGYFSTLGGLPRSGLGAVDLVTGAVTSWNPAPDFNGIDCMVANGSAIFISSAGFTHVGGQTRAFVAALDPVTGAATSWNPAIDSRISAFALSDSVLYMSGDFTSVAGQPRDGLAGVDIRTGLPTSTNAATNGGNILALALNGDVLCVGGRFGQLGGQPRAGLGAVDTRTGEVLPWDPQVFGEIYTLAVDSTHIYAGGYLNAVDGAPRSHVAAFDRNTGELASWNPGASDLVRVIATGNGRVFVGGGFAGCGGVTCKNLAGVDLRTGRALDWAPVLDNEPAAMALTESTIAVAGWFANVNGLPRPAVAQFDRTTLQLTPWSAPALAGSGADFCARLGSSLYLGTYYLAYSSLQLAAVDLVSGQLLPWSVETAGSGTYRHLAGIEASGTRVYIAGEWETVNGQARPGLAAVDARTGALLDWDAKIQTRVDALTLSDSTLFISTAGTVDGHASAPIVAIDTATARARTWASPDVYWPYLMCATDSMVYIGCDAVSWLPPDNRSSAFAAVRQDLTPAAWQPYIYGVPSGGWPGGGIQVIRARGRDVFVGGYFQFAGDWLRDGLARLLPPDPNAPTVEQVSPGGAEVLAIGHECTIRWTARDDRAIASADVLLSRSGPTGPWELLAAGITGADSWNWQVSGPPATGSCWLRVVVRDWAGNTAEALSASAFDIVDPTTPTLVELFRATETPGGVQLEWQLSSEGAASVTVERGTSASGGWSEVHGAVRVQSGLSSMLDTGARPEGLAWYRLALAMSSGALVHTPPIQAGGLHGVTEFALGLPVPNPAAGSAVISYALPQRGPLRLSVLDIQGRERSVLLNGAHEPGVFTAALDSRSLQPGLYFIRLQARGVEIRRRVVVIH